MAAANPPDRGDDREAIDRAFADLVAGYHLTADRAEPSAAPPSPPSEPESTSWADDHPLFAYDAPAPVADVSSDAHDVEERFVPPPPPPLPKPAWPVLLGWLGMGYAVLMVLAVVVGARLPAWTGWLAVVGFVAGFGILVARLPRHRPPDAGDGAVL